MESKRSIAKIIVNDVFNIQANEKLIITVDRGTEREVVSEMLSEAHKINAQAFSIEIPEPDGPCSGVNDYVAQSINDLLRDANCWLDAGSKPWIYSNVFEESFRDNPNLRYMVIGGIDAEGMMRLFGGLDIKALKEQTDRIKNVVFNGKKMRFECKNGTSFDAVLEHEHVVAADVGDASIPGFHTPPALLNIVPAFGQVNGVFTPTALMIDGNWTVLEEPLKIKILSGKIVDIQGKDDIVSSLENWLKAGDDASSKFAHLSIGLSQNLDSISGDILYDERINGALNCGFGHVSPLDAPPNGQESKTHFDAITENISIWVDDKPIIIDGKIIC